MRISFCASEGLPFSKSGGLGDVIGTLPYIVKKEGIDVNIFLPLYKTTKDKHITNLEFLQDFTVYVNNEEKFVGLWKICRQGVDVYFIENDQYFYRDNLYGYDDDGERFSFFQKAILESYARLDIMPDIVHSNDWHTAMLPFLTKKVYPSNYKNIKHVYTIHNILFQGIFSPSLLDSCLTVDRHFYNNGDVCHNGMLNFMKSGINYADIITTVSKTYAKEILTHEFGEGLEYPLRHRSSNLVGIVNGIDTKNFSPSSCSSLYENYNKVTFKKGKLHNKHFLQKDLGLKKQDTLLVSMISRLTEQKGLDILIDSLEYILNKNIQFVILGSGDKHYTDKLNELNHRYENMCFYDGYNEDLAKKIYAASDLFLMPSLFEPCGLSQLISMHMGTLPLVRETGGLIDTVTPYNKYDQTGTGFSFSGKSIYSFMEVFDIAYNLYYDEPHNFKMLIKNAMSLDLSFEKSAKEYLEIYKLILNKTI